MTVYTFLFWEAMLFVAVGAWRKRGIFLFDAAISCIILFVAGQVDPSLSQGISWLYLVAAVLLLFWSFVLLVDEVRSGAPTATNRLVRMYMERKEKNK